MASFVEVKKKTYSPFQKINSKIEIFGTFSRKGRHNNQTKDSASLALCKQYLKNRVIDSKNKKKDSASLILCKQYLKNRVIDKYCLKPLLENKQ
jgi:phosphoribosylformylglycinamidine (FGAM) synthase PurS component